MLIKMHKTTWGSTSKLFYLSAKVSVFLSVRICTVEHNWWFWELPIWGWIWQTHRATGHVGSHCCLVSCCCWFHVASYSLIHVSWLSVSYFLYLVYWRAFTSIRWRRLPPTLPAWLKSTRSGLRQIPLPIWVSFFRCIISWLRILDVVSHVTFQLASCFIIC